MVGGLAVVEVLDELWVDAGGALGCIWFTTGASVTIGFGVEAAACGTAGACVTTGLGLSAS